jgi:putative molybdopterin biosynthesis protein
MSITGGQRSVMKDYFSVVEVAGILKVSAWVVRNLIKKGELPAFKIGKEYRVNEVELQKYLMGVERAWKK